MDAGRKEKYEVKAFEEKGVDERQNAQVAKLTDEDDKFYNLFFYSILISVIGFIVLYFAGIWGFFVLSFIGLTIGATSCLFGIFMWRTIKGPEDDFFRSRDDDFNIDVAELLNW